MTITIVASQEDPLAKKSARWLAVNAFIFNRADPKGSQLSSIELRSDQRLIRIALGETRTLDYAIEALAKAELAAKREGRKLQPVKQRPSSIVKDIFSSEFQQSLEF